MKPLYTAVFAVGLLSALPATAQDLNEKFYLGNAMIEYGWINCPAGTVDDEKGRQANQIMMQLDPAPLKEYRKTTRETLASVGDRDVACSLLKEELKQYE